MDVHLPSSPSFAYIQTSQFSDPGRASRVVSALRGFEAPIEVAHSTLGKMTIDVQQTVRCVDAALLEQFVEITAPISLAQRLAADESRVAGPAARTLATGQASALLSSTGFVVLSINLRPTDAVVDSSQRMAWLQQMYRLESDEPREEIEWRIGDHAMADPDDPLAALCGGSRAAFEPLVTLLSSSEFRSAINCELDLRGRDRRRRLSIGASNAVGRLSFRRPYTFGCHIALSQTEGGSSEDARTIVQQLHRTLSAASKRPSAATTFPLSNTVGTCLVAEFSTIVCISASDVGAPTEPSNRDGSMESAALLPLVRLFALRKGILRSLQRVTLEHLFRDDSVQLAELRYWAWLLAVCTDDFVVEGWSLAEFDQLLEASESGDGLKGVRSLEMQVRNNLDAFESKFSGRSERLLTLVGAFLGFASLFGVGLDLWAQGTSRQIPVGLSSMVVSTVIAMSVLLIVRVRTRSMKTRTG